MDGTLLDSEKVWELALRDLAVELGGTLSVGARAQMVGGSMARTVGYLLARATRPAPPEAVERWMMDGVLARVRAGRVAVRPGVRELLAEVAHAGLPHALVTSSQRPAPADATPDSRALRKARKPS